MSLPGFGAESTLYNASRHYQRAARIYYSGEITPQQFLPAPCGSCYLSNGECVQDCTICRPCPPGVKPNGCGGCDTVTKACALPGGCASSYPTPWVCDACNYETSSQRCHREVAPNVEQAYEQQCCGPGCIPSGGSL